MTQETNGIEQWILRVGRGFGVLIGVLAAISIALGAGALVLGAAWIPLGAPSEPVLPPRPEPPPAVKVADAERFRAPAFTFDESSGDELRLMAAQLGNVQDLKALFPEPVYAWDNVVEEFCRNQTSFGCLERGRRVVRRGVGRHLAALFDEVERDDRAFMIGELERLLPQVEVAERAQWVGPLLVAEIKRQKEERKALEAWDSETAKLNADYSRKQEEHRAQWGGLMFAGGSAIGSGISAALAICLVVAALAIERHLRTLSDAARRRESPPVLVDDRDAA